MAKPFTVNVSSARSTFGVRKEIERSAELDELQTSGSRVPEGVPVSFEGTVEAIEGPALVVEGVVTSAWSGDCRRCLGSAAADILVKVREVFEPKSTEGETYPLKGDFIDLEPLVREVVMLELPSVPLCRDDCAGLCVKCGANLNETTCNCDQEVKDLRWAALDQLR